MGDDNHLLGAESGVYSCPQCKSLYTLAITTEVHVDKNITQKTCSYCGYAYPARAAQEQKGEGDE